MFESNARMLLPYCSFIPLLRRWWRAGVGWRA
jgi:hypothetical protein